MAACLRCVIAHKMVGSLCHLNRYRIMANLLYPILIFDLVLTNCMLAYFALSC